MMNRRKPIFVMAAALCIASSVLTAGGAESGVPALVAKMPAKTRAEEQALFAGFVKLGPVAIKEVCKMLVPPGTGNDTKVRYALDGLGRYVCRPGAEVERRMYTGALIESLGSASDNEVKAFLIRQIQKTGKEEAVAPLGKFLTSERLCEPATQALLTIQSAGAAGELIKVLPSVRARNRVTIIKALGKLRSKVAVDKIIKYATSADVDTRLATLYALADSGALSGADVLAKAAQATSPYERAKATSFYLLYAQRLAETGKREQGARICREMIRTRTDPGEKNVACAALSTLVTILGKDAWGDLLAAVDSRNKEIREAALFLARSIPGKETTAKWVEKMETADLELKVAILAMLGRRGDRSALPGLLKALEDKDKSVRLAAIPAVDRVGGNESFPALLVVLQQTDDADEIRAIKEILMRSSDNEVLTTVAKVMPKAPFRARPAFIEIMAARRANVYLEDVFAQTKDDHYSVRIAAIRALGVLGSAKDLPRVLDFHINAKSREEQSAAQRVVVSLARRIPDPESRAGLILAAMDRVSGEKRAVFLDMLPKIGGNKARRAVVAETRSADAAVRDAAVRALTNWPDASAAPDLMKLARSASEANHRILALRGYLRVVKLRSNRSPEATLKMYKEAMTVATRADERKLVLSGLRNVRSVESLRIAASCLDDQSVNAEAATTAIHLARHLRKSHDKDVIAAMQKVVATCKSERIVKQAQGYLEKKKK